MFHGFHSKIDPRGDIDIDISGMFDKTMNMYRRYSEGNKSFALMHCYRKLKKNHKWQFTRLSLSKGKDAIDLDAPLAISEGRPIGNKATLAGAASTEKTHASITQCLVEVSLTLLSRDKKAEEM
ncbi:hypothetical protein QYE76_001090 [Lolium multiflorum]|uniref:Uncharacterized protein n=1 Tax=Lolium multiflorum TaxID=4521 RepID=A0AAD8VWL0_LOLMU|nr:hypothetical protein QYE76_001090 [Lolium multiflorum]